MSAPPVGKGMGHAQMRSIERYGKELKLEDLKRIREIIKSGGAIESDRISNHPHRTVYELVYKNSYWRVVVDDATFHVVTVLPMMKG